MRKFNTKLLTATAIGAASLLLAGCMGGGSAAWKTGPDIGGGVIYPFEKDKTGPYYINDNAHAMTLNHGRIPTKAELNAWDADIMAGYVYQAEGFVEGRGLPEGSGSVEEGEALYEAQCVSCHGDFGSGGGGYPALSKGNAEEMQKTLTNNRMIDPEADGPIRVFGSYWPQASTMWWYIRDGMPHPKSKTLTADETYALTAYMLNINEMSIDGELVDEEYVLDREKFIKIKMPNENGFEPNIKGPGALQDVRNYFNKAENFGAVKVKPSERCMTNCQSPDAEVVYIDGGITEFNPPLSAERALPPKEGAIDPKEVYTNSCAMCHDGYLSPGSSDWAGYTAKGMDKVYENGINGTAGGMPPMGGASLSKEEFKTVVDYVVNGK